MVDAYRTRWVIEEFSKALKTGRVYQEREFQSRHALLNLLALSLPVACELLWLRSRARTETDAPGKDVLAETQIRILREMSDREMSAMPTNQEVVWALAGIGGHVNQDGEPGWQILGRSYKKLLQYEIEWRAHQLASSKRQKK